MIGWELRSEFFTAGQQKHPNQCFLSFTSYNVFLEGLFVSLAEFWPSQLFHSITAFIMGGQLHTPVNKSAFMDW